MNYNEALSRVHEHVKDLHSRGLDQNADAITLMVLPPGVGWTDFTAAVVRDPLTHPHETGRRLAAEQYQSGTLEKRVAVAIAQLKEATAVLEKSVNTLIYSGRM